MWNELFQLLILLNTANIVLDLFKPWTNTTSFSSVNKIWNAIHRFESISNIQFEFHFFFTFLMDFAFAQAIFQYAFFQPNCKFIIL